MAVTFDGESLMTKETIQFPFSQNFFVIEKKVIPNHPLSVTMCMYVYTLRAMFSQLDILGYLEISWPVEAIFFTNYDTE